MALIGNEEGGEGKGATKFEMGKGERVEVDHHKEGGEERERGFDALR